MLQMSKEICTQYCSDNTDHCYCHQVMSVCRASVISSTQSVLVPNTTTYIPSAVAYQQPKLSHSGSASACTESVSVVGGVFSLISVLIIGVLIIIVLIMIHNLKAMLTQAKE